MMPATFEALKEATQKIHNFGLGFIQLKLTEQTRLHFYTLRLPRITPEEEIHNHRYHFNSKVLKGTLHQRLYDVTPCPESDWTMEDESCSQDRVSDKNSIPVKVVQSAKMSLSVGSNYFINYDTFHNVTSTYCITELTRGPIKKAVAQVVRHNGSELVCPFSKVVPEAELWEIVRQMLKS
jgi:hypothetical protein